MCLSGKQQKQIPMGTHSALVSRAGQRARPMESSHVVTWHRDSGYFCPLLPPSSLQHQLLTETKRSRKCSAAQSALLRRRAGRCIDRAARSPSTPTQQALQAHHGSLSSPSAAPKPSFLALARLQRGNSSLACLKNQAALQHGPMQTLSNLSLPLQPQHLKMQPQSHLQQSKLALSYLKPTLQRHARRRCHGQPQIHSLCQSHAASQAPLDLAKAPLGQAPRQRSPHGKAQHRLIFAHQDPFPALH